MRRLVARLGTRFGPGVAMLALVVLVLAGGPRLHLAFEDRGDPRPGQFALSADVAGLGMALVISWSKRTTLR